MDTINVDIGSELVEVPTYVEIVQLQLAEKPKNKRLMGVARSKELRLNCRWTNCQEPVTSVMIDFIFHLRNHVETYHQEQVGRSLQGMICKWTNCQAGHFTSVEELHLHVSGHGFHTKLVSYGRTVIEELQMIYDRNILCQSGPLSHDVLLDMPSRLICLWDSCHVEFSDVQSFYNHVDQHVDNSEAATIATTSQNSTEAVLAINCLWEGCGMTQWRSKSHLKEHIRSHTQAKAIACPSCGAWFVTCPKFVDHVLRQPQPESDHGGYESEPELILDVIDLGEAVVEPAFDNEQSAGPKFSTLGCFRCTHCEKMFATKSLLSNHERSHLEKAHVCTLCGYKASKPSALIRHIRYRHSKDRPHACPFCSSKFKTINELNGHLITHGENQFKCSMCNFNAKSRQTLTLHTAKEHTKRKLTFICHHCDEKFSRGNNLTRHLIKKHNFTLPAGKTRCTYAKQADGSFKFENDETPAHFHN